jgi:hypothetical protein
MSAWWGRRMESWDCAACAGPSVSGEGMGRGGGGKETRVLDWLEAEKAGVERRDSSHFQSPETGRSSRTEQRGGPGPGPMEPTV